MKLQELGAHRPTEQIAKVFESQHGTRVDFDRITPKQAQSMLGKVRALIREHRASPSFHYSERNPDYMKLVMMEQALVSRIAEQTPAPVAGATTTAGAVDVDPAKTAAAQQLMVQQKKRQIQDMIRAKQKEIQDLQRQMNQPMAEGEELNEKYMGWKKTVSAIKKGGSARDPEAVAAAIGRKKYGKEKFQKAAAAGKKLGEGRRRLKEASDVQQAQVVMAAQDMVDQVQKMMEQISSMQFKDLPALVDAIKNEVGVDQANKFQADATAALGSLLSAVQQGKTQLEAAQGVLTGQAPVVPGADMAAGEPMPAGEPGAEVDADLGLDANLPPEEDEEELAGAALGRERR